MDLLRALQLEPLDPPDGHCPVVTFVGAGGKTTAMARLAQEWAAAGRRVVVTTTTRLFRAQAQAFPARWRLSPESSHRDQPWEALARLLAAYGICFVWADARGEKVTGVPPEWVDALAVRAPELGVDAVLVEGDGSRGRPVKAPADHEPVVPASTTVLVPVLGLDGLGRRLVEPFVHRPERLRALLDLPPAPDGAPPRLTPEAAARLLVHPRGGARRLPPSARLVPLVNKADYAPYLAVGRLVAHRLAHRHRQGSLVAQVGAGSQVDPVRERWGSTAAVVLAAGESRRMGQPKQLLRLEGEPLVVRAARLAAASDPTWVVVVLGAQASAVQQALAPLQEQWGQRLRLVVNPRWVQGQSTSVAAAVQALPPSCQAVLFLPVDQPQVPVALLRRLWAVWREGGDRVAVAVSGEPRGAPAVFHRSLFGELLALEGDVGARRLLRGHRDVRTVPADPGWLVDVDTPEDWERLRS